MSDTSPHNNTDSGRAPLARIGERLAEPFDPAEVRHKPMRVLGNRALAMFYISARAVMDRLDDVLGCENWQDSYTVHEHGSVECRLACRLGGEWVTKTDVGSLSAQPGDGDKLKAAYSDALKRAAIKFGVGRYLYSLSPQWADYDPVKKHFVGTVELPDNAKPKPRNSAWDKSEAKALAMSKLKAASEEGPEALDATWKAISAADRKACQDELGEFQRAATAVVGAVAQEWAVWITSDPNLDQFNAKLPELAKIGSPTAKSRAKALCEEHAREMGLTWDRRTAKYVQKFSDQPAA